MTRTNVFKTLAVVFVLSIGAQGLFAQMSGLDVMEAVYNRPTGDTMNANLVMTITNSRGATRERSIIQYSLDAGSVEKKIMFFTAPADVRDTSFMTWSWDDGRDDDQWIYLPSLRRVKRISSDSKNDSFMGSDFTYDDLGERHPSEDVHKILREEALNGERCYVVESVPKGNDDAFSKTLSWVIKDKWIGLKKEYYDDKGNVIKILNIEKSELVDNYWVVTNMVMEDLERKSSTRIEMKDLSFSISLDDNFFTERQMKIAPRR